jgi:prevent-host-death family protein
MGSWQVQQAKARLSEAIERARSEGPQTTIRHGAERAVVLSIEDYRALVAHKPTSSRICSAVPRSTIL